MKKLILCLFLPGLLIPCNSYSWTAEGGSFSVSKLRFGKSGVYVALNPAPSGCQGGTHYRMHFKVLADPEAPNQDWYHDMVAGLLSAHASGQKLNYIWYSDEGECSTTHVLSLEMFEFADK